MKSNAIGSRNKVFLVRISNYYIFSNITYQSRKHTVALPKIT